MTFPLPSALEPQAFQYQRVKMRLEVTVVQADKVQCFEQLAAFQLFGDEEKGRGSAFRLAPLRMCLIGSTL
jgi:hypothetical protein